MAYLPHVTGLRKQKVSSDHLSKKIHHANAAMASQNPFRSEDSREVCGTMINDHHDL
ncbi:MAG: hypothetical protein ABJZ55_10495 [Fuerstiella sp.]